MNISVIIPAFNEEENLKLLLPHLKNILSTLPCAYELIVVDSLSTNDNTEYICTLHGVKYVKQHTRGYADAFRTGINNAVYDAVLVVDADNSQDIAKIPLMYKVFIDGFDIVIGSRYIKGGTTSDSTVSVIMSKILNNTYRIVLDFKEKDISTDFRLYRKSLLMDLHTQCRNFDVIEETLFLLKIKYPSIKVAEVPIDYRPRLEGFSKRRLLRFIMDYIKLTIRLIKLKF